MTYLDIVRAARLACEKSEISEKSRAVSASGVHRGPVEASPPPAGWDGIAPAGCGALIACRTLGPCRHFTETGRCWKEAGEGQP
jgi:hypothetical protein